MACCMPYGDESAKRRSNSSDVILERQVLRRAVYILETFARKRQVDFEDLPGEVIQEALASEQLRHTDRLLHELIERLQQRQVVREECHGWFQLGILTHLRGEYETANQYVLCAVGILENLAQFGIREQQLMNNCCFELGVLALTRRAFQEAKDWIAKAVQTEVRPPWRSVAQYRRVLERCDPLIGSCP
jgi:hypothetical protein